jgi:hypothetical protein
MTLPIGGLEELGLGSFMLIVGTFCCAGGFICFQHLISRRPVNAVVTEHYERADDRYLDDPIAHPRQYVIDPPYIEWARDNFPEASVRRLERLPDSGVHHLYVVEYEHDGEHLRAPLTEGRHSGVRRVGDKVALMVNPKDPRQPISGSLASNLGFAIFGIPVGLLLLLGGGVMIYDSFR